ncbi:hypothetical protein ACQKFO_21375 [Rossellomorea sp. NPDC071047]|uniref:hypothetical protein n=1 Tax=Rossellomorea sp. NPDC071047 TaxID=3390675 RepID=UPI003D016FB6
MIFDFYTDDNQFTVTESAISKNGEVIAEGSVFVFYLMLGYPAWFIVNGNAFCPPQTVRTKPVTSILPHFEVYDGEINPKKQVYEVNFEVTQDGRTIFKKYSCVTVDELHAIEFIQSSYPAAVILDIQIHKSVEQQEGSGEGIRLCL